MILNKDIIDELAVDATCCTPSCADVPLTSCNVVTTVGPLAGFSVACSGRLVNISLTIDNVCPGSNLAVAIILYDPESPDNAIGLKTFQVTGPTGSSCAPITITNICFVVPGSIAPLCTTKTLKASVLANYTNIPGLTDFLCAP